MPDQAPGLSSAEAAQRLVRYGPNEPVSVHRLSALVQLVHLFANPLVIILLVAGAISALLGEPADAVIIITIVLLVAATPTYLALVELVKRALVRYRHRVPVT